MTPESRPAWSPRGFAGLVVALVLLLVGASFAFGGLPGSRPPVAEAGCNIYVAAGDDVPNGHDLNNDSKRYPEQLVENHIKSPGWCLYNQGKNGQTSLTFITEGGLANAYNMRPDLLTIQLGGQNDPMVKILTDCFDKVQDHDFTGALSCAAQIYGDSGLWDNMRNNFTTILQQTRIMHSQRPQLVVAVVNYPNPYPQANDVIGAISQLCTPLIDTTQGCMQRWSQYPAALTMIDQVVQKLNQTLKDALAPFQQASNGYRWVYVDVYPKFKSHCMKMTVSIYTTVFHPPNQVHQHNSTNVNMGCSQNWFTETYNDSGTPNYLEPPTAGILVFKFQTTRDMGKYPNADGHKCINDAIWEADTILPGTTPLKWLLGYGEASNSDICQ